MSADVSSQHSLAIAIYCSLPWLLAEAELMGRSTISHWQQVPDVDVFLWVKIGCKPQGLAANGCANEQFFCAAKKRSAGIV